MDEKQHITTILRHRISYDNKLDLFVEDLSSLARKRGNFILYVNAGNLSGQDWVAWIEAKIEIAQLPDLIITEIWKEGDTIHYKMKNIGDASIGSSSNSVTIDNVLFVDGGKVATDHYIGTIGVKQEVEDHLIITGGIALRAHHQSLRGLEAGDKRKRGGEITAERRFGVHYLT